MHLLGLLHSASDPSAALITDGKVIAFIEEERLLRNKHAFGAFPFRAIDYVLSKGNVHISDVDYMVQAWDSSIYDNGEMRAFYDEINRLYPPSKIDLGFQQRDLENFGSTNQTKLIHKHLRQHFGDVKLPDVKFVPHHRAHACMSFFDSGWDEALVLSVDGRGEEASTSWWLGKNEKLNLLHKVHIPHSLGWFYSSFTEFLGFRAYDGEYNVMGLAAYGKRVDGLKSKINDLVWSNGRGGFETNPAILSRGVRNFSNYFPDALIEHMNFCPRAEEEKITQQHMDLAFCVQERLEEIVLDMTHYWTNQTGIRRLAIGGGVGLNIKMNGRIFSSGLVDDLFVHPLCADTGVSIGGPIAYFHETHPGKLEPKRLQHVYFGSSYDEHEIEKILRSCKLEFSHEESIEKSIAQLLAKGNIVGWFQNRMEGGPRALGNRSILADPRRVESRDQVNAAIKYREHWRPFCPSMTEEGAKKYLQNYTYAPFMALAFDVNEAACNEIPAVVHVDETCRVQIVDKNTNMAFHKLLEEFNKITSVPCVLNTSFNVKGEPIVCTPLDAVRTFSATGLDALAIGPFMLRKPHD